MGREGTDSSAVKLVTRPFVTPGAAAREQRAGSVSRARAWTMVALLALLSTFAFLDRNVLALLLPDLKRDIGITDVQFGVLIGPCFIIVYNFTLIVGSLLVDRWNRKLLIGMGATIWATMTIGAAFAHSYTELLMLRAGLAFGEAFLGPAAVSLIGDLFERDDRALPTATYIAGSVTGVTGSTIISAVVLQLAGLIGSHGEHVAALAPWRLALVGIGAPCLVLALLLLTVGREPTRPTASATASGEVVPMLAHLRSHGRLYAGVFIGYGMLGTISVGIVIWGPTHLIRLFGLTQVAAGYLLGTPVLVCSVIGTLTLPIIFRRMVRQGRADRVMMVAAGTILSAAVIAALAGTVGTLIASVALFGAAMFLAMGVATLSTLVIQLYTPSNLRGRISAALFFTVYLFSAGLTPVIVPLVAQSLFRGPGALGHALSLVVLCTGTLSAVLVFSTRGPVQAAELMIAEAAARKAA